MTIICDGQSVMECNNNQENMFSMLEGGSAVFAIAVGCIVKQVRADLSKES